MLTVDILLHCPSLPAFSTESYIVHDQYERFAHGRQLRIFLPKGADRLEFTPADDPNKTFLYWERGRLRSEALRDIGFFKCAQDVGPCVVDVYPFG